MAACNTCTHLLLIATKFNAAIDGRQVHGFSLVHLTWTLCVGESDYRVKCSCSLTLHGADDRCEVYSKR